MTRRLTFSKQLSAKKPVNFDRKISPSQSQASTVHGVPTNDRAKELLNRERAPLSTRTRNYSTNVMRTKRAIRPPGAQVTQPIRERVERQVAAQQGLDTSLRAAGDIQQDFKRGLCAINYAACRATKDQLETMTAAGELRDPRWKGFAATEDAARFGPAEQEAYSAGMQSAKIIKACVGGATHQTAMRNLLNAYEFAFKSQADLVLLLTEEGATSAQKYAATSLKQHVQPELQNTAAVSAFQEDSERTLLSTTLSSLTGQLLVQPFVRFFDLSTRLSNQQRRLEQGRAGTLSDQDEFDEGREMRLLNECAKEVIKVYKLTIEKWDMTSRLFTSGALLQKVPGDAQEVLKVYGLRLSRLSACAQASGSPFQELLAHAQRIVAPHASQPSAPSASQEATAAADVASVKTQSDAPVTPTPVVDAKALVAKSGLPVGPIQKAGGGIYKVLPPPPVRGYWAPAA